MVNCFWNFNITFLATWGCASNFIKMLPKFKMAPWGQLQIFFCKVLGLLKFKIATTDQFQFLCGRKHLVRNYSHLAITYHTIGRSAGDISYVLLKFQMAASDHLQILLWAQKLKAAPWDENFQFWKIIYLRLYIAYLNKYKKYWKNNVKSMKKTKHFQNVYHTAS